ncbi:MAG: UvrD-helicase domain-containing protein [Bacilli bacterium]|nr:UvrD-helicase domain-containing protein [Bacilli bacterium]
MKLDELNERQKEAVMTTEGPLLVIAGAGSGKTKVLTTRIAYLIEEKGISFSSILAITFTNKAAKEMKERVVNILGNIGYKIQISTFHSFGLYLMHEHAEKLGYESNFTILDSDDSLTVIKKILKDMDLDSKEYNPRAVRSKISGAKNSLLSPAEYEAYAQTEFEKKVVKIYDKYQTKLLKNNSMDFDDLLMLPIILFRMYPEILKIYQERFEYVLIDEYQDTNEAQYLLTKMISAKYKNICVVGDEDQTIYSWRGSDYKNILNFEKDYENPSVVLLEENYRSTKNILNAANSIIKNNKERKGKVLWTDNEEGPKIHYHRLSTEKEEAEDILHEIESLLSKGVTRDEIAILYRTNAQSRVLEEAMLKHNMPYKVIGSFYFYNRKEIKDLIAYLKLLYNPKDDVNLLRIINVPKRGIGLRTIANITENATLRGSSIYDAIQSGKELSFKNIIEEMMALKESLSLTELVDLILEKSGMRAELQAEKTIEAEVRLENLEEFKSITKTFEEKNGIISLEEFLGEISLVSDVEEYKDKKDVITLMTVHSAKGLEFDYVFMAGVEEGIFPHNNSLMELSGVEEERRLCYVAITRAKKELWIENARRRTIFGMESCNPPSRFIGEISDSYLEALQKEEKMPSARVKIESKIDPNATYAVGDHIVHDSFGNGIVVSVDKMILTIAFPHPTGIKKLMKGHKSIRKV